MIRGQKSKSHVLEFFLQRGVLCQASQSHDRSKVNKIAETRGLSHRAVTYSQQWKASTEATGPNRLALLLVITAATILRLLDTVWPTPGCIHATGNHFFDLF